MNQKSFISSLIILLVTIALVAFIAWRGEPVVIKTNLENIPMEIGGYRAEEDSFPDSVYEELNADKHVYRHYRDDSGREIDLYIGYYGTAKGGRTWHTPHGCLRAAGWVIIKSEKTRATPSYYSGGVTLNCILARKGEDFLYLVHWYQSAGKKVFSTEFRENMGRLKGKILYRKNDGAFIQVSFLTKENGIEEARLMTKDFAEKLLNLMPNYWPVEE